MRISFFAVATERPTRRPVRALALAPAILALCLPVSADLNDPTRPPPLPKAAASPEPVQALELPQWRLTFVKIGPSSRQAVINGVSVTVGDELDDAIVVKILSQGVELKLGERTIAVKIHRNESIKRRLNHAESGTKSAGSS